MGVVFVLLNALLQNDVLKDKVLIYLLKYYKRDIQESFETLPQIEIAKRLKDRADVLLIHDLPKLSLKGHEFMRDSIATQSIGIAIYGARPNIVLLDIYT